MAIRDKLNMTGIRTFFGVAEQGGQGMGNAHPQFDAETQALFDIKRNLIEQVRANASMNGIQPTLEHYRLACLEFAGTEQGLAMVAKGEWNVKNQANLEYQDLSGFVIREPKLAAAHEQSGLVEADYDGHDRDGDGKINIKASGPFYDNIRFDHADLHGAFVEPATSFNDEIAKAKNHDGMTFNGMQRGDVFTFGAGVYNETNITNVNDGKVIFADHTQANTVTISGRSAEIEVGNNASVNHIHLSDGFRVLDFKMGRNSLLADSDLSNATISPSSHFEPGSTLQNVHLGRNVVDLDVSGLKLINVTIEDKLIQKPEDLKEFGITYNEKTVVTASKEAVLKHTLDQNPELATLGAVLAKPLETPAAPTIGDDGKYQAQAENYRLSQAAYTPERMGQLATREAGVGASESPIAKALAAATEAGSILKASQETIGQQITDPQALAALQATEQAFKARQDEQSLGGPSRKA